MDKLDIKFMKEALKEAKKALKENEVPVGAILVKDNKIIARSYNQKEKRKDATGHAEILLIKKASKKLNNWRLNNTTIYVTLEPCAMCASAISQSRISRLIFALEDKKNGAVINTAKIYNYKNDNLSPKIEYGICEQESKQLLQDFFKTKRIKK